MTVRRHRFSARNSFSDRLPPAVLFATVWLILPNLVFVPLWFVGGPPRPLAIMIYVLVGLAGRMLPIWAVAALLLAAFGFDVILVVSGIFNLAPTSILHAIRFLPDLRIFESNQYLILTILVGVVFVTILSAIGQYRHRLRRASAVPALLSAGLLMTGDHLINVNPEQEFGRYLSPTAPFHSAMGGSGLRERLVSPTGRNLVMVMVESMGHLENPDHHRLLTERFRHAGLRRRYQVEVGYAPFYGSTTSAELRELCGRWATFDEFLDEPDRNCLPARLSAAGYRTVSVHGFTGNLFDRRRWYPNIGFQELRFAEEMYEPGDRICDGVFAGLCDIDVADHVAALLDRTQDRPHFIHWLTLNTHLPVIHRSDRRRLQCEEADTPLDVVMVCAMTELWIELFDSIIDIALTERPRPTDFLIVGDHAPPFWIRRSKAMFVSGQVPWILLRDRRTMADGNIAAARAED